MKTHDDDDEGEQTETFNWTEGAAKAHPLVADDVYRKAHAELTNIFLHFQKTMDWPKWQESWWKQRKKVLESYGMTVEGFFAEIQRRKGLKPIVEPPKTEESNTPAKLHVARFSERLSLLD